VTLQSSLCSGSFLCGLTTSLPSGTDMLLGNDLCPSLPAVDLAVTTRFQSTNLCSEAELQTPLDSAPEVSPVEAESVSVDKSVEVDLASLYEVLVGAESFSPELLDRAELIRLQQSDPGLSPLFEQAEKGDKRYLVRSGVLLRTSKTKLALPHRSIYQIGSWSLPPYAHSCSRLPMMVTWECIRLAVFGCDTSFGQAFFVTLGSFVEVVIPASV